jgi:hypothetical protein
LDRQSVKSSQETIGSCGRHNSSAIHGAQLMHYLNEDTIVPPAQITVLMDDKKEAKVPNPDYTI